MQRTDLQSAANGRHRRRFGPSERSVHIKQQRVGRSGNRVSVAQVPREVHRNIRPHFVRRRTVDVPHQKNALVVGGDDAEAAASKRAEHE